MEHVYLNYTKEGYVDYTHMHIEDPPQFYPFQFEIIDYKKVSRNINKNPHYAFIAIAIYMVVIFGLKEYMKTREAFKLKTSMAIWNGGLGLMSICGFLRTCPEFFYQLSQIGFHRSVCNRQGGNVPFLFWALVFVFSKYVELGDTVFLVLRKKPITFLQWGHHTMTLAACWIITPFVEPIGRYYVVMNFGVHSLMYPYFALMAMNVKIPRAIAKTITTLQLSQMILGLFINLYSAILYHRGVPCDRHPLSINFCFCMYGIFACLFGQLFYDIFFVRGKNQPKKTD